MLMNTSKVMFQYVSDLGVTYNKVPFKIKEGYQDIIQYADRDEGLSCSPTKLFNFRYLEVTYDTGEKIQHPIGRPSDVIAQVRALLNRTTAPLAVCINYVGERWPYVPASIIGLTSGYNTDNRFVSTARGLRENGTFSYNSDVLGTLRLGYSIEKEPDQLLQNAKQCMEEIGSSSICVSPIVGFKPRRYIQSYINQLEKRISRFARISQFSNVAACGRVVGAEAICLAYEGESIANIHNLVSRD